MSRIVARSYASFKFDKASLYRPIEIYLPRQPLILVRQKPNRTFSRLDALLVSLEIADSRMFVCKPQPLRHIRPLVVPFRHPVRMPAFQFDSHLRHSHGPKQLERPFRTAKLAALLSLGRRKAQPFPARHTVAAWSSRLPLDLNAPARNASRNSLKFRQSLRTSDMTCSKARPWINRPRPRPLGLLFQAPFAIQFSFSICSSAHSSPPTWLNTTSIVENPTLNLRNPAFYIRKSAVLH
jgi:hypothetical protein